MTQMNKEQWVEQLTEIRKHFRKAFLEFDDFDFTDEQSVNINKYIDELSEDIKKLKVKEL